MTLPSEPHSKRSGFTLFEALISLAILSLVLAVSVSSARAPSPALQAKSEAARLIRSAGTFRLAAINDQETTIWTPDADTCEPEQTVEYKFFADGTAVGPDICLFETRLRIHPLTGHLLEVKP